MATIISRLGLRDGTQYDVLDVPGSHEQLRAALESQTDEEIGAAINELMSLRALRLVPQASPAAGTVVWYGETPSWDRQDDRHGEWPKNVERIVLLRDGECYDSEGGYDMDGRSICDNPGGVVAYGSPLGQVLQVNGYLPRKEPRRPYQRNPEPTPCPQCGGECRTVGLPVDDSDGNQSDMVETVSECQTCGDAHQ